MEKFPRFFLKLIMLGSFLGLTSFSALAAEKEKKVESASSEKSEEKSEKKKGLISQISGQGYGTAGCGLGSILFGESEGLVQIFAYTTNGLYSHQTFAISSGTSNCDATSGDSVASSVMFIETNKYALANDIARGEGETLHTLLYLMKCDLQNDSQVQLQKNYSQIFSNLNSNPENIRNEIHKILVLNNSCSVAS
jgi:hypothetical protein